jgi:hypothetical protein
MSLYYYDIQLIHSRPAAFAIGPIQLNVSRLGIKSDIVGKFANIRIPDYEATAYLKRTPLSRNHTINIDGTVFSTAKTTTQRIYNSDLRQHLSSLLVSFAAIPLDHTKSTHPNHHCRQCSIPTRQQIVQHTTSTCREVNSKINHSLHDLVLNEVHTNTSSKQNGDTE